MRKLLSILIFCCALGAKAQTAALTGFCTQGATPASTSGLHSTNNLQGIVPKCTVTVYLTGTITIATIYADNNNTPLANPFTATTKGQWTFFAAVNQGYDVVLSGGTPPNTYATPITLTSLYPAQQIITPAGANITNQANGVIPLATAPTVIAAQSHLDDGITTSGTLTASRPFTGNVNKVLSVIAPPYNAKCDGTTDDQTAIQSAFNDALSQGKSIQFPAGTCLTSTITFKGQSFFGAGKGITFIKGKPGQDVLQTPDNNSYLLPQGTTIHDLNIVIDTTVNAAATAAGGNNTFPNRIAGTVQNLTPFAIPIVPGSTAFGTGNCTGQGASATASTSSVSIVCPGPIGYAVALIDPNLVNGSQITINGAGTSGGTYTGTITSIASGCTGSSACHLNVNPAISTTVTNASGSMLNAQTPPWYIGNAGIAIQCSNGASCGGSATSWNLYNIEFDQSPTTYLTRNNCAAFFTQAPMYGSHFEKMIFLGLYAGYVEASPVSGGIGTGDTSSYKDMDFYHSIIPMVTINGNDRDLSNINFYSEYPLEAGPYYLTVSTNASLSWTIHGMYLEGSFSQSGEFARFMTGLGSMHITGANVFGSTNTAPLGWVEFQSNGSFVDGYLGQAIKVDGNANEFRNASFASGQIIDNGLNNRFYNSAPTGTNNYMGRRYNPSQTPNRDPLGTLDGSFLLSGNSQNPYSNASDLFFTCSDWTFTYNPSVNHVTFGTCVPDPTGTEISHRYFQSANATQTFALGSSSTVYQNMWAGASRTFGVSNTSANGGPSSIVPRTKVLVSITAQCVGAATCTAVGHTKDGNTGGNITSSGTLTFANTWTTQSFISDLSSTTVGHVLDLWMDGWSNAGTSYQLAWIAVQPLNQDQLGGLTVVDSSGAGIITGPTTSTSGDVSTFNGTTGKLQDSGTLLTALTKTIASGTSAMGTGAISATSCAMVVTTSATGTASTDSISWAFNAAPSTGYTSGLQVLAYATTNNVNFLVCNGTAGSLTPAAATLNWRVTR